MMIIYNCPKDCKKNKKQTLKTCFFYLSHETLKQKMEKERPNEMEMAEKENKAC
jgi:hypothetical protein